MESTPSHLTRFFRNSRHFKLLEYVILPDLLVHLAAEQRTTIAVWSAGCSTGQEVYSLAMLLSEMLPAGVTYSILALDRSPSAIDRARRGVYTSQELSDVPARLRDRYFTRRGSQFCVTDRLRRGISFEAASVGSQDADDRFDLVLCRNVLTYVDRAERPGLLQRLWQAMMPYSYLLVGGSESLIGVPSRFTYRENRWSSYYRKVEAL